jgi:hypothetical protein
VQQLNNQSAEGQAAKSSTGVRDSVALSAEVKILFGAASRERRSLTAAICSSNFNHRGLCDKASGRRPFAQGKETAPLRRAEEWHHLEHKALRERPDLWQEVLEVAHGTAPNDVYLSLKQFLKK